MQDESLPVLMRRSLSQMRANTLLTSDLAGGVHVLALGGANTNNVRHIIQLLSLSRALNVSQEKDYGYLYSLSKSILDAIPGSTNVSVPYDKVLITNPPPNHLQPGAVANGVSLPHLVRSRDPVHMLTYITDEHAETIRRSIP